MPRIAAQNVLGGEMQFVNSASCTFRNGTGINPPDYTCVTPPVLGSNTPAPTTVLGTGNITITVPSTPTLAGTSFTSQGVRGDAVGPALQVIPLNAQDFVVGY